MGAGRGKGQRKKTTGFFNVMLFLSLALSSKIGIVVVFFFLNPDLINLDLSFFQWVDN